MTEDQGQHQHQDHGPWVHNALSRSRGEEARDNGDQPGVTDESSQLILLSSPIDMQGARHIKQLLWLCVVIYCYSCTDRRQKLSRGAD